MMRSPLNSAKLATKPSTQEPFGELLPNYDPELLCVLSELCPFFYYYYYLMAELESITAF